MAQIVLMFIDDFNTTVVPGTRVVYRVDVENGGDTSVGPASVSVPLPAGVTSATWSVVGTTGGATVTGPRSGIGALATTVDLPVATITPVEVTFSFVVNVDPSATGALITTGTISPPTGTPFTAIDVDALTPEVDLSVAMTDGKTTAVPGTSDTYTITVTNSGPSTLSSLSLADPIPAALLNPIFGAPSAGSYDPLLRVWSGLSLASGQSVSITLTGTIDPNATGPLTNTVTVAPPPGTTDTNPVNNTASDTDTLTPIRPNPSPPSGTSANMILRGVDGIYVIYDIGNNAILAAYPLAQVGTDWQVAGFNGSDTSNMMLRNSASGAFQVYDVSNNNITSSAALGTVGLNWQVAGFGNFSSRGETDMMLRDVNTGGFQVYDIANNQITGTAFMGTIGLDWQVGGFGNFSSRGTSDMILRNATTGGLQVYNIDNNQITSTAFMGTVGLEWHIIGVGNFSSMPGETDIMMRNTTTGGLEVYDVANNQITGASFLGTVGLDWHFAGVAPVHAPGASDLVLRNVNTGAFEAYDIANNQIIGAASLGQVGLEWQVGGFAANPAPASTGSAGSTSQLVQAMAAVGGGGAADGLNTALLNADASQQTFLTQPQA